MKKEVRYAIQYLYEDVWLFYCEELTKREAMKRLRKIKKQMTRDKWRCVRVTEEVIEE